MKPLIMLNLLNLPFLFVCLTIVKDFCYSSFVFAKFNLIASKLVALDARLNMMLKKFSFNATPKITTAVLCNLFIVYDFLVLFVLSVTLAKQKECFMKGQLNMLGLIITVLFTNLLMTAQVSNICLIMCLCIHHCLRHNHLFTTVTNFI